MASSRRPLRIFKNYTLLRVLFAGFNDDFSPLKIILHRKVIRRRQSFACAAVCCVESPVLRDNTLRISPASKRSSRLL